MSIDRYAREVYERWKDDYSGEGSASLEDVAERLFPHLPDDDFFAVVARAETLAEDASYAFAFGHKPERDERGVIVSDPRHGPEYREWEAAR